MSFDGFDLQSMIDIGFVIFVSAVCLKTLLVDRDAIDKQRKLWQAELLELQKSLKDLITEASAASQTLDRRLLQRKKELELLLERLEERGRAISEMKPPAPEARTQPISRALPPEPAAPKTWSLQDVATEDESSLATLLDTSIDLVKLTEVATAQIAAQNFGGSPAVPAAAQVSPPVGSQSGTQVGSQRQIASAKEAMSQVTRSLSNKIEVLKDDGTVDEIYERTSIVDPVTYKIACRLLMSGKEIHVVARKLELPVSEIRMLDRLLRHEENLKNPKPPEALEELKPAAIIRAPKGLSEASLREDPTLIDGKRLEATFTTVKSKPIELTRTVEQDIERELQLL